MYENGRGVAQDSREAVKWFRKATEHGDAVAQFNLGVMYENGQGVPQNYTLAYALFILAAAGENNDAVKSRGIVAKKMTPAQIEEGQAIASSWRVGQPFPTSSKTGRKIRQIAR